MQKPTTDWQGVLFGVTLGILAAYQYFKMPPVLPILAREFGYGRTLSGGLMSVYSVAGLALSVAVGRALAQGRSKALLLAGFAALMLGNFMGLLVAGSGPAFLASRLLEGAGFSVIAVVGGVWTILSAAPEHRAIATALWTTWMPVGQLLASLIAIPAARAGRWTPLWWLAVVLTVAVAAWGHFLVRGDRADRGKAISPPPTGTSRSGGSTPFPLVLAATVFCLWSAQYFAYMTWLPTYLVEKGGLSPGSAAMVYLAPPVLVMVFNLSAGMLLRAGVPLIPLLACTLLVQALSWVAIPFVSGLGAGVASLLVYGVAAGLIPTCIFALPTALEHAGHPAASGFSALMTGRNFGTLVGPVLLGQAIAALGTWHLAAVLFAVGTAAAVVPALLLGRYTHPPGPAS